VKSKLPHIGTTIFTVMSHLANEHKALNMAQGFPDFSCSEKLISLVHRFMKEGCNQYAPMPGVLALREKISEKTQELYQTYYHPDSEITVTCGATEACFLVISALVEPGDEVLILEPAFDVYAPVIELNGGKAVYVKMEYPEFSINWKKVKEKFSSKTKLIILNSPHNPTGAVISKDDLEELSKLVEGTDTYILSDEVYEHIVFDNIPHSSILYRPELKDRTFVVSSFGKTFHITGWRIGYCLASKSLTTELRKIHQFNTFSTATPMQFALAEFLKDKSEYLDLPSFYQKKRDLFLELIKESRFEVVPSKGTYFQLLSFKNITEEKDTDFAIRLTRKNGIASIPVSVFYNDRTDHKVLRFCFAKENKTLEKAAEILCRI
jgi:methionine aminotransferase